MVEMQLNFLPLDKYYHKRVSAFSRHFVPQIESKDKLFKTKQAFQNWEVIVEHVVLSVREARLESSH